MARELQIIDFSTVIMKVGNKAFFSLIQVPPSVVIRLIQLRYLNYFSTS